MLSPTIPSAQTAPRRSDLPASCASLSSGEIDTETSVGGLGSGDGLEDEINRCARGKRRHLRCHMGQNAALDWNEEPLPEAIDQMQQPHRDTHVIPRWIDPDDGIAGTQKKAVEHGRGDAGKIVGGMIGLKPRAEPSRQPHRGPKAGDDANLCCREDQVLHAHEFAHRGSHLRCHAGRQRSDTFGRGLIR